jgi:hypothetical protein
MLCRAGTNIIYILWLEGTQWPKEKEQTNKQ